MKPICRKCLLEDMENQQALLASIRELIGALPDEKRADEETRKIRLACCRECSHLKEGTCGLCGCFVELRAAKNWMHCPDTPGKW